MSFDLIAPGDFVLKIHQAFSRSEVTEYTFIIGITEIVDNKSFYGIHITDDSTWYLVTSLEDNGTLRVDHFPESWLRYCKQFDLNSKSLSSPR